MYSWKIDKRISEGKEKREKKTENDKYFFGF